MANTTRKFYGTGDAKNFNKKNYFEAVQLLLNGEDIDADILELLIAATDYELEGIAIQSARRSEKQSTAEKKDPMQSEYCNAIRAAVMPLMTKTPVSAGALAKTLVDKGIYAPKTGKAFPAAWIARVLQHEDGVTRSVEKVVVTNAKGYKNEQDATVYRLA